MVASSRLPKAKGSDLFFNQVSFSRENSISRRLFPRAQIVLNHVVRLIMGTSRVARSTHPEISLGKET